MVQSAPLSNADRWYCDDHGDIGQGFITFSSKFPPDTLHEDTERTYCMLCLIRFLDNSVNPAVRVPHS